MVYNVFNVEIPRGKMFKKYKVMIIIGLIITTLFLIFFQTMGEKYTKNHALWQSHNIQSYAYTVNLTAQIDESSGIDVDIARVVVYRGQNDKNFLNGSDVGHIKYADISSVENIFKRIEKLINKKDTYLMGMCIDYDSQYGYPKTFTVAYKSNVLRRTYNIQDFRILSDEKLKEDKPVCASYRTTYDKCNIEPCPSKVEDKSYRNRYTMEMAGAVYKYDGQCKFRK